MRLDTNFNVVKQLEVRELTESKSKLRRYLPRTFVVEASLDMVRAWGGRRVDAECNPFTYALIGEDRTIVEHLYRSRLKLIRQHFSLKEEVFDERFFSSQQFKWLGKNADENTRLSTLSKELGLGPNTSATALSADSLISLEMERLTKLYSSIQTAGYISTLSDASPIRATLAIYKEAAFFLVRHGEHRVACLPCVGETTVKLWVRSADILYVNDDSPELINWFRLVYCGDLIKSPLTNVYGYFFL